MALFGVIGLVLGAIGVYGVLSSSVAQRPHEIGIRAALGAIRPQLIGMVLRDGVALAGAGAIAALALSVVTGRLISSLLQADQGAVRDVSTGLPAGPRLSIPVIHPPPARI
jgi:putative ABC transport system permease protein